MREKTRPVQKQWKDEEGMMVVEAVLSFTVFIIVCLCVVYLINIFMVHNRIQFALNSAAHEVASYTYLYEGLGLREADEAYQGDVTKYTEDINNTVDQLADSLNKMQGLYTQFNTTASSVQNVELNSDSIKGIRDNLNRLKASYDETSGSIRQSASSLKDLFSDPEGLIAGVIYLASSRIEYAVKGLLGTAMATGLTNKYLEVNGKTVDQYLQGYGIEDGYDGLDFGGSTVYCDDDLRLIDFIVQYDIEISFAKFFFPDSKIHMVQRVTVSGWVGDGQRVPE